jgi:hypothetical protein
MGVEQGGYTPEESIDEKKDGDDLSRQLFNGLLKENNLERLTKEQIQELLSRMHEEQKPANPDNEVR